MKEEETDWEGTQYETRFFEVSADTYRKLEKMGALASVSLVDWEIRPMISVSAELQGEGWMGWFWMHDEFKSAGLELADFQR